MTKASTILMQAVEASLFQFGDHELTLKIYSYKNCSTCKNALKYLEKKDLKITVVDITETPPKKSELNAMLEVYEGNFKKLFNTSGQVYRDLGLTDKLASMSARDAIDLLSKNGKLIKRPFLMDGERPLAVGFKEDEWMKVLK
jgi:arsenate reductase